ncbi:MAG: aminoglycoside phosphotransferase family protein [Clostridia bacterium]|nr:aminoglycoside phosphotransferase family protein [Clostridia bacterium]
MMNNTKKIVSAFDFSSPALSISECKIGHINSTYFVDCAHDRYVIQKIKKEVFKDPPAIMANLVGVTDHIRAKLAADGGDVQNGALQFVKSGEHYYHIDDNGEYWRAYRFIDGICYESCDTPALFTRVGTAFGNFQNQLSDYDISTLYEAIPNFHNTAKRYEAFEAAVAADICGRAKECAAEIAFIRARRKDCSFIVDGLASGAFPLRVTHNDTKPNNVIIDKKTGVGLCVIDLDTVMPGSLLYDFGDAIRFGASSAREDETDLDKVYVRAEMFDAYTKGFVKSLSDSITKEELRALPEGARILTLEQGMRFLTDHLQGDTYFRIHREGHNLERTRTQLKLVADMEKKHSVLQGLVAQYY